MSQQARDLLAKRAEHLFSELSAIDRETAGVRDQAKSLAAQRETALEELRTIQSLQAMLDGTFVAAPRDVQSDEGVLGLRIAGLSLSPQPEPSVDDLRLWAAVMREVYQQATHQAALAQDVINERERRERGEAPTEAFPAVPPRGEDCAYCGEPITRDGDGRWRHSADDQTFTVGPITAEAAAVWGHVRAGSMVTVYWLAGGQITGQVREAVDNWLLVAVGDSLYDVVPAEVARVVMLPGDPEVTRTDVETGELSAAQPDGPQEVSEP